MPCRNCSGTGITALSVICQRCSGTGEIIIYDSDGTERMQVCPKCEDGMVYVEQTCSACKGTGEISPSSS